MLVKMLFEKSFLAILTEQFMREFVITTIAYREDVVVSRENVFQNILYLEMIVFILCAFDRSLIN